MTLRWTVGALNTCDRADAPMCPIVQSQGSRAGQNFVVGNGHTIPNRGQMSLKLEAPADGQAINSLTSTFQTAKATRPLMSVSNISDGGMTAELSKAKAVIREAKGRTVCTFKRVGGLYVCKMRLKTAPCEVPSSTTSSLTSAPRLCSLSRWWSPVHRLYYKKSWPPATL